MTSPPGRYDGQDRYDTVTWAAGEQWSNGRIGTWGRSYGGLVQWQLAHLRHPNVTASRRASSTTTTSGTAIGQGGAFQLALTLGAAALWSSAISLITGSAARDVVLNDRIFAHLPLIELDEVTIGRKVDYWRLWWEHQTNDEYWQSFRHRPELVNVPIFQQGAWFDPYSGSHMRQFAGVPAGVPNRVLIGPWSHEEEVESFRGDIDLSPALTVIRDHELEFYDRYLKDVDNGWEARPPAELYVLGANEWRGENEWPLARTAADPVLPPAEWRPVRRRPAVRGERRPLRLRPGRPRADDRRSELRTDDDPGRRDAHPPGPIDQRVLEAARRRARLHERAARERPGGRRPGRDGALRGIVGARHRLHRPPLRRLPRRPLDLPHRGHHPRALPRQPRGRVGRAARAGRGRRVHDPLLSGGERLQAGTPDQRLDVTSSSFPRFSRNLNTGEDVGTGTRMQVAHQTVLHTSIYPSRVVLPVIPAS